MLNVIDRSIIEKIKLSQLSHLSQLKRHTLNARIKTKLKKSEVEKNKGNQILLTPEQTKTILEDTLNSFHNKIIYIGNLKGGVGKTTIAYLLVSALKMLGKKICIIDLDVQANLTSQFIKPSEALPVFYDLIDHKKSIKEIIIPLSNYLHIIPSSLKNSLIPKALSMQSPKHHLSWFNKLCLDYLRLNYDIIVVDTPPSLSTLNSVFCLCLNSNDHVMIPVCADNFSSMGVQMFLDDIMDIRKSYAIKEDVTISIIMNRFFQTQKNNLEMLLKITKKYKELISEVVIKDSTKIKELNINKMDLSQIKSGREVFEILSMLLQELNILKGTQ